MEGDPGIFWLIYFHRVKQTAFDIRERSSRRAKDDSTHPQLPQSTELGHVPSVFPSTKLGELNIVP